MTDLVPPKSIGTIALFDSGVGGLSVLRQLASSADINPHKYLYLGDTARCPYGDRPAREIKAFVSQIVQWLCHCGADAIVMACNTSYAQAYDVAKAKSSVPVFDLVSATAEEIGKIKAPIGIMATSATARARAFSRAILQVDPAAHLLELACPDLVPLVESGNIDFEASASTLSRYVDELIKAKVGAVVLGCTHFPFFEPVLKKMLPDDVEIIDPARFIVNKLAGLPYARQAQPDRAGSAAIEVYVTGSPSDFAASAEKALGYDIGTIYGIALEELVGIKTADAPASSVTPQVVAPVAIQAEIH